jgi:hypothetical protein
VRSTTWIALGAAGILVALAAGLGAVPGMERSARANGRFPATVSIHFRQGHETDIVAGVTFGLLISHDGGATWQWMCDEAIGIAAAAYDPLYEFTPAGSLFARTAVGLVVMRDGCTFGPAASGFVSTIALGPDGAFFYGAAQTPGTTFPVDFHIYRSIDDGVTFPVHPQPDPATDINVWWESIAVATSSRCPRGAPTPCASTWCIAAWTAASRGRRSRLPRPTA